MTSRAAGSACARARIPLKRPSASAPRRTVARALLCLASMNKALDPHQLGWRTLPGALGRHASSPQSVHALLGYFLKDRKSPTPFPGRDMLATEGYFDWGLA